MKTPAIYSAKSLLVLFSLFALPLFVTSCATPQQAAGKTEEPADNDPLEPINRLIFGFNRVVDTLILRPVTVVYRFVVPEPGRDMVDNAIENLYTPVVFANSLLQGDVNNGMNTLFRFTVNSSFGIAGLFDVASEAGLMNRKTDFGQTMAMYGIDSGPYTVLPVIGPSTTRDSFGRLGDAFMHPFTYFEHWYVPGGLWAATAVNTRSNNMELIDGIYESSLDPYATFRSAYLQKRAADIRKAKAERDASIDKLGAK